MLNRIAISLLFVSFSALAGIQVMRSGDILLGAGSISNSKNKISINRTAAATTTTTTSSTTSVAVTTPDSIGTAYAWWRMDDVTLSGSDITNVNDKIGTNDLTAGAFNPPNQNATGLNSLPVAEFLDTNTELLEKDFGGLLGSDIWISIVAKAANNTETHCFVSSQTIIQDYALRNDTGNLVDLQAATNFSTWTSGATGADTNWHHYLFKVEQGSGNHLVYMDFSASTEISSASSGVADARSIRIGACGGNDATAASADYGEVSIAEVVIWTAFSISDCTTDDCSTLKTYYCDRYSSSLGGCP